MQQTRTVEAGWHVYDEAGDKIGTVEQVGSNYLLVRKGIIFVKDVYVPFAAITTVDEADGAVSVSANKADIDQIGWDQMPPDEPSHEMAGVGASRDGGGRYPAQSGMRWDQIDETERQYTDTRSGTNRNADD
jgi:hypothetical protein